MLGGDTMRHVRIVPADTLSASLDDEAWMEISNRRAVREVVRVDDRYYCSLDEYAEGVGRLRTAGPIEDGDFMDCEVSGQEFERVWAIAVEQRRMRRRTTDMPFERE